MFKKVHENARKYSVTDSLISAANNGHLNVVMYFVDEEYDYINYEAIKDFIDESIPIRPDIKTYLKKYLKKYNRWY